jgi:hypothetical protein
MNGKRRRFLYWRTSFLVNGIPHRQDMRWFEIAFADDKELVI